MCYLRICLQGRNDNAIGSFSKAGALARVCILSTGLGLCTALLCMVCTLCQFPWCHCLEVSVDINQGFRGFSVEPTVPLFGQLGFVLLFPNTEVGET